MNGPLATPPKALPLRLLAVDDEEPALAELAYLLRADPRVGEVLTAGDAAGALRVLDTNTVDGVLVDIRMPGLSGLELARALGHFADPPPIVVVSAYDDAAVDAYAARVVDYLLKPLSAERLAEAVRRIATAPGHGHPARRADSGGHAFDGDDGDQSNPADIPDETIPVELAGVTRYLHRSEVRWVEAQGDYARLHTVDGGHLVRVSLAALEERWARAGFVRIHRSYLVAAGYVSELRGDTNAGYTVQIADTVLPVSRRSVRMVKDLLVRAPVESRP